MNLMNARSVFLDPKRLDLVSRRELRRASWTGDQRGVSDSLKTDSVYVNASHGELRIAGNPPLIASQSHYL